MPVPTQRLVISGAGLQDAKDGAMGIGDGEAPAWKVHRAGQDLPALPRDLLSRRLDIRARYVHVPNSNAGPAPKVPYTEAMYRWEIDQCRQCRPYLRLQWDA